MKKNLKKVWPRLGIAMLLTIALSLLVPDTLKKLKTMEEKPMQIVVTNISTVDAKIFWQTDTKSSYKVHYKDSTNSGVFKQADSITVYGDESNNRPITYSVKIDKLEPNTKYDFRISSSNKIWEEKYTFETDQIGEKVDLPKTITGKGDIESLYLLDSDGSRYMFDTQYHGTWAFDAKEKEFTIKKYATYSHKDSKLTLLKNKLIGKLLAHEDYKTKDGVRDGILINDANPIRHCADADGCVCIFGDQNSTDRRDINMGESCSKDRTVADSMRCCRSADGTTVKWMNAKECLRVPTNTINLYEEQSVCIEKTPTPIPTPRPTPPSSEPTVIPGFDPKVYAKFPSDGYVYDAEDIFFRLITGDYKNKDNDVDTNLVNEAWSWRRVCKDVDGCICQYPDGSTIRVVVGETCIKDRQKEDTMECCLYESRTKRSYITVKECMQKSGFEIIEQSTKEKCESEYVCCSLNGNLKYKLDVNCQKAGGVSISGVTSQNCKAQTKEIVISKGVNFIEAYYILSANTPIRTAKELIVFSQNKVTAVGIFRNDKWEKLVVQENGTISGEDFPLLPNESYLIIATEEVKIPTSVVVSQKSINLADYTGWNLFASSSVTSSSARTSEQIFNDAKYNNVRQIAQWSSDSSSFKYAVRDIDNSLYGDKLTITDQQGVFIKTTK